MAAGAPPCWLRLCRPIPYPTGSLRSVTLLVDTGALVLDVTAGLEVDDHDIDPDRVAGVDLGIIHPIAARHHMDARRSCPASGRPAYHDGESLAANQPCEDQPTPRPNSANAG